MKIERIYKVYFSPTGNTKNVVGTIADSAAALFGAPAEIIDFTLPSARTKTYSFTPTDLVVFGTPVYAGRVPNKILPFVQEGFSGCGAMALPVVTFGNRSFDDGLMELRNELTVCGFHCIAAGAFPSAHVFSSKIAADRPDDSDLALMNRLGQAAAGKIALLSECTAAGLPPVEVRGNDPVGPYYRPLGIDGQPAVFLKAKPKTDLSKCTKCGLCSTLCPMGSIDAADTSNITGICIKCQACVKSCPVGAKYFDDPAFLSHVAMLEKNYQRRAEAEIFI